MHGWRLDIVPQAGYRHDADIDPRSGARLPAVLAAVSTQSLDRGRDRDDRIRFVSQSEHMHTSHARHSRQFDDLGKVSAKADHPVRRHMLVRPSPATVITMDSR